MRQAPDIVQGGGVTAAEFIIFIPLEKKKEHEAPRELAKKKKKISERTRFFFSRSPDEDVPGRPQSYLRPRRSFAKTSRRSDGGRVPCGVRRRRRRNGEATAWRLA